MSSITKQQAWKIYDDPKTPNETVKWERPDNSGLLLAGCPKCGEFETRESYVSGRDTSFWVETVELITDYSCVGIARCKCGQWAKWYH